MIRIAYAVVTRFVQNFKGRQSDHALFIFRLLDEQRQSPYFEERCAGAQQHQHELRCVEPTGRPVRAHQRLLQHLSRQGVVRVVQPRHNQFDVANVDGRGDDLD